MLVVSICLKAQTNEDLLLEQLMESIANELPEDVDNTELTERWIYYLHHPIDLNATSGKELAELQFLSPLQVASIVDRRKETGSYLSVYELQSIAGLTADLVRLLLPFVQTDPSSEVTQRRLGDYLKDGKYDALFRYSRILEQSKGYTIADPTKSRYLGSADRLLIKYRYQLPQRLQVVVNMKKDAGEQFFTGAQRMGFDFYSGSIALQSQHRWKQIVLGDYTLQFGQGLALWSGLSFGKGALVQHVARLGMGLRPYTSTNEYAFFRGLAATYALRKISITPFVSYKPLSATFADRVDDHNIYSAISKTGLHRTPNEVANRYKLKELVFGANAQFQSNGLTIGVNTFRTQFAGLIQPREYLYNSYSFRGQALTNSSIYYSYAFQNIYAFGELAKSFTGGLAYTSGLISTLSHELSLVLQYRNYQKDYHAFYNQAIAEGSEPVNEKGFYTGLIFQPSKRLLWVAYVDYFKFPWLRYRVDAPSDGQDMFTQLTLTPNKQTKWLFRYRYRNKLENGDLVQQVSSMAQVKRQQLRAEIQFRLSPIFNMRNRAEWVYYKKADQKERGYLVYQDMLYKPMQGHFSGNFRFAYFHTDGYNARIYAFENDVLYASSFPFYSDKGFRYYLNLRYKLKRGIDFWCRYGAFLYPQKETLGSGLDTIEGKHKSEIKAQIRVQF
ncbi:helix-hairpin-helix domain-containing protein [Olivibacter ginsenosidimutans]|uniref:Helix-hairpin-helix domain-containing protein n=1 Tax=Olivibacter ginsenosidimutans TaxID=1176537 RepID=A0ABP9CAZ6_9SPHI